MRRVVVAALLAAALPAATPARARTASVPAVPGAAAAALDAAAAGDTLVLAGGVHRGPLRIERAVTLRGAPGAVLEGGGEGTVLEVVASGAAVEDLAVRGSGRRMLTIDAGIHVVASAGVTIRRVRLEDVLYGVYGERAPGLAIEDCRLTGRVTPLDEFGEGNGIHLWHSNDARLAGNSIERFLDGIYLSFAHRTLAARNRMTDNGRYGFHTMYCQDNRLLENLFASNAAGCAIMFSNHLAVERNDILDNRGPRTYGLLLRDCSDGAFRDNRLVNNTIAIFMDNSNRNRFGGNLIQDNGWGLLVFSSCDDNVVAGNSFLNNDYPVALDTRRTTNRFDDGRRGNYWSDNAPYDLDGDGVSDVPYSPVGAFAFLSKQYPDLSVLAKSPAVSALGVAERVVPAMRPSEVVDRHPLLAPAAAPGAGSGAGTSPGSRPAWAAAAGFAALALAGAGSVRRKRRVR